MLLTPNIETLSRTYVVYSYVTNIIPLTGKALTKHGANPLKKTENPDYKYINLEA